MPWCVAVAQTGICCLVKSKCQASWHSLNNASTWLTMLTTCLIEVNSTYCTQLGLNIKFVKVQMAKMVAQADWASALQHLLSQAPATPDDQQLCLHLLPLVDTLLATHAAQPSSLQLLAVCLRQAALPVLSSTDAAQAAPSLPVALTNHADASFLFDGAQEQLVHIQLTQV